MTQLIETFKVNKLNELVGMERYITHMNKWFNNLSKIFILSLEGNTGIGKSLLATLFLEDKKYNILYFDISSIKSKTIIFDKIKESFKTFDVCSMLQNKKRQLAYIIDNIDNNSLSKLILTNYILYLLKIKPIDLLY